jgi:hypothetical protein
LVLSCSEEVGIIFTFSHLIFFATVFLLSDSALFFFSDFSLSLISCSALHLDSGAHFWFLVAGVNLSSSRPVLVLFLPRCWSYFSCRVFLLPVRCPATGAKAAFFLLICIVLPLVLIPAQAARFRPQPILFVPSCSGSRAVGPRFSCCSRAFGMCSLIGAVSLPREFSFELGPCRGSVLRC